MTYQNFNDEILQNEAFDLRNDFTSLEQLKIARNLINLVYNDIWFNVENDNDEKTCNTLTTITLQLNEIIKNYDEEVKEK